MSMSDRKAELEKKKARLQLLKDEKEKRRKEREKKEVMFSVVIVALNISIEYICSTTQCLLKSE